MSYPISYRGASAPSLWEDAFGVRREFDRWLDRHFAGGQTLQAWAPAVDVKESADEIVVTAELAGLRQEDVNVTVQNGVLTISGEKRPAVTERENAGYHLQELHYGRFERSFSLPQSVAADGVRASLANGVLTVKLPKTAAAKPRRIKIDGSDQNRVEVTQNEPVEAGRR
jgi:HSP20 family protein